MRKAGVLLAGCIVAAALSSMAGAGQGEKVTGGGQTEFGTGGAGDTIAFTIQDDETPGGVKGQFQYVDRSGGTGQGGDSWHGTPICLEVDGTMAKAVIERNDNGAQYELLLQDNGQGQDDDDIVSLTTDTDPMCDPDQEGDDTEIDLGRGNIQVTDD